MFCLYIYCNSKKTSTPTYYLTERIFLKVAMFSLDFSSLLIADNLIASTSSKLQYENPRDKEQRGLKI